MWEERKDRDERLIDLASERLSTDGCELDLPINEYIAALEHTANTDFACADGLREKYQAEARMYAELRDSFGAKTPNQALDVIQIGSIDPATIKTWIDSGALHTPVQGLALITGYHQFGSEACE